MRFRLPSGLAPSCGSCNNPRASQEGTHGLAAPPPAGDGPGRDRHRVREPSHQHLRRGPAHVLVLDQGIGLCEDDAAALFAPFYRSATAKKQANGIGVGLAVCKRVVDSHGGRTWAKPRAGGGSEFGFSLPIRSVAVDLA